MITNRLAIASPSLGQHPSHILPAKIAACAEFKIAGLEVTYPDLDGYAQSLSIPILEAATKIRNLCFEQGIYILSFASFQNFEGHTSPLSSRLAEAKRWINIARELGAEHLQIPSSYDRTMDCDRMVIISELRALADVAAAEKPAIKVAYENLGWSTHCVLWQEALEIVNEVGRGNFALCLDTFHLAVALWGDPFSASGKQVHGAKQLEKSLKDFVKGCPEEKIFYIQLSDGERFLGGTWDKSHPWYDPDLEIGHVWSNEARPFPYEENMGAYMPVQAIAQAFLDTGYSGWISLETFDRRMRDEAMGPVQNARRAASSWQKLKERLSNAPSRSKTEGKPIDKSLL